MKKILTCALFIAAIALFLDILFNLPITADHLKVSQVSEASGKMLLITILLIIGLTYRKHLKIRS